MDKQPYKTLVNISSKIEKMLRLRKEKGNIIDFKIERISDDNKLEIFIFYSNPIKKIKTIISLKKKNANNI